GPSCAGWAAARSHRPTFPRRWSSRRSSTRWRLLRARGGGWPCKIRLAERLPLTCVFQARAQGISFFHTRRDITSAACQSKTPANCEKAYAGFSLPCGRENDFNILEKLSVRNRK